MKYTVKVEEYGTCWFINGKFHREDGPAIECKDGEKHWYINGKLHREGGPAIERPDGYKSWYINGELHKEDGPAIEFSNGIKEYWINGTQLTEEEFSNRNKKSFTIEEIKNMSLHELHKCLS